MKYLVSSENSGQYHWQLELLIESFRMTGMDNDLIVCLAEGGTTNLPKNLSGHPNKVFHENIGREMGYPPFNTLGAMRAASDSGVLSFPFALISPDMILVRPIELDDEEKNFGVMINNFNDAPLEQSAKDELDSGFLYLAEKYETEASEFSKIPLFGWPVVFNKPSEEHFVATLYELVKMEEGLLGRMGPEFPCERVAWTLVLAELSARTPVMGKFMSGPILFEHNNMNFIDYSRGIPPVFHKKHYDFWNNFQISGAGPIDALAEAGATVNADHARRVIESYRSA